MNKRDMFYSNYNASGYINQPMMNNIGQGFIPNQMVMPNMMPNQMYNQNMAIPNQVEQNCNYDYEERITKLERQIRSIDARVSKLEQIKEEDITYNTII